MKKENSLKKNRIRIYYKRFPMKYMTESSVSTNLAWALRIFVKVKFEVY